MKKKKRFPEDYPDREVASIIWQISLRLINQFIKARAKAIKKERGK